MSDIGVIFDMDGVLIDSYDAHFKSWRRMLETRGLEMTESQFAETFGRTNDAIISELYPDCANDADTLQAMADEKEVAFREVIREHFPEMPGAGELVQTLAAEGFHLAVGSSGPRENVETVLECLSGGERFEVRVTGCDVDRGKPDPQVFLIAAGKLGLPPERCVVVEDAPAGVEAARRAGMGAIALTGTAGASRLGERAHVVVEHLDEITPAMVRSLLD